MWGERDAQYKDIMGETMYSRRNYNVNEYKLNTMIGLGRSEAIMKAMFMNAVISKALCLQNAGKDADTTMFAIDRDDEYKPEFKTCFKE